MANDFTSGIFGDMFVVDEKSYRPNDDMTCFKLSKMYHSLPDGSFIKEGSYEKRHGRVINEGGNRFLIHWYDNYKPFTRKLRVYKIWNMTKEK